MNKISFLKVFIVPEAKSIAGRKYVNLFTLSIIFILSILSLSLGYSIIDYLRFKMDNPFIKFISVTNEYKNVVDYSALNDAVIKKRFHYGEVTSIRLDYRDFLSKANSRVNALTRLVNTNEEFYSFIINPINNILLTENTFNNNSYGVIVSEKYLRKLGYSTTNYPAYITYCNYELSYVPIPICAIVKQLPEFVDLLVGNNFYTTARHNPELFDIDSSDHSLKIFIPKETIIPKNLVDMGFSQVGEQESFAKGITIRKLYCENLIYSFDEVKNLYPDCIKVFEFKKNDNEYKEEADRVSFSFYNLDSIRPFQEYLSTTQKLMVDMNTIETKENFRFFEKLSTLLSITLIIFSILAIVVFVSNLILSHFEKNKKNLGTLKAFGLSNNTIIALYSGISISLIFVAFAISIIISWFLGNSFLHGILEIFKIESDKDLIKYHIYPIYYLISIFIIVPAFIILFTLQSKLYKRTPGDLIYERD
jgi:hypothetical protein